MKRTIEAMLAQAIGIGMALAVISSSAAAATEGGHHGHDGHAQRPAASNKSPGVEKLPPLQIVSPQSGAKVGRIITVEFETPADLAKMTMDAAVIGVHLHVDLDGTSLMPASTDLTRTAVGRYRYTFDLPVHPGPHVVKVYWSDAKHKTIEESVKTVRFTVVDGQPGAKQ